MTAEPFAPRRTGKDPEELSLTGKLVPFADGWPCLFSMPLSPHTYLACFDSEGELREMMASVDLDIEDIKRIDDGINFLSSLGDNIIVITNMRWTDRGTLKFSQVLRVIRETPLTDKPCPVCVALANAGKLRIETVMRVPEGAYAPLGLDGERTCLDCASAGTVVRMGIVKTFEMARVAVANDRQESMRLPGVALGLIKEGLMRMSQPGDFEEHLAWLRAHNWFGFGDKSRAAALAQAAALGLKCHIDGEFNYDAMSIMLDAYADGDKNPSCLGAQIIDGVIVRT